MKNPQPHFERVKTEFFQAFKNCNEAEKSLLMNRFGGRYHERRKLFDKEFNQFLDGVDIRSVSDLIDEMVKHGKASRLPSWIRLKQFTLNYNANDHLDLIKNYRQSE